MKRLFRKDLFEQKTELSENIVDKTVDRTMNRSVVRTQGKKVESRVTACVFVLALGAVGLVSCGSSDASTTDESAEIVDETIETASESAEAADASSEAVEKSADLQDSAEGEDEAEEAGKTETISSVSTYTVLDSEESQEFDEFLDELFAEEVTDNTIDFHYSVENPEDFDLSMDEVTFGTIDLDNLDTYQEEAQELLEELESYSYEELSESQQFIYDLLEDTVSDTVEFYDYYYYQTVFSPTTGVQAQLPIILSEYEFRSQEDVEDYLLLLADVDNYFSQLLEIEEAKSEMGLFMSDFTAESIIEQCEEFIADPEENLLLEIFEEKLEEELPDLSDEEVESYIAQNEELVLEEVIPAYQMIIDTLTELEGTGTNEGGLANFEDGADYYALLAKSETGSSMTVDEMISLTEEQLTNDLMKIALAYAQDEDVYTKVTEVEPESTDPIEILEGLQESILDEFPEPVSTEFTVKYVHESLQEDLSPAFYMIPAVDAQDSNTIYINSYYTNSEDAVNLYTTLAHEGYPGHLYETTWFYSTDPHPIRKILSYSGYSEGWATYVEMLSYYWLCDEDDDLVALFMAADGDLSLGICARVDMGVNYEGWDRDDTAQFLDQFGLSDEETTDWLFETVVAEPASYLSYYIGYLEFEELREEAEETLGDDFDAVEFHTFILTTGAAPFDLIEEQMQLWMD